MKLLKGKAILMALGLAIGAIAAVGATLVFGESLGLTGKAAETKVKYIEKPKVGIMLPMRERIVNLADPGAMRYLKVTMVLELADYSGKEMPKGEEYKKKQDELKKDMAGTLPLIDDEITAILTSKTSGELMTPDGKQRLRDDLRARINKALEKVTSGHTPTERQEVLAVYFSDFIIQ
ncbi:MAG: flagellar basal body-associated FliL family protein [Chloroflexi bacterium]|nr:flagellar basal body-associated FliL family protein [Chloroflexota bacterium]